MNLGQKTIRIDEFPFTNRENEIATLLSFCMDSEFKGMIFLLEGASGIGKSRLLEKINDLLDPEIKTYILHSRHNGPLDSGILETLKDNIKRFDDRSYTIKTGKQISSVASATPKYLKTLTPKLARATPIFGVAAEHITSQILSDKNLELKARGQIIKNLLKRISEINKYSTSIIFVDDIHSLSDSEQESLCDLIALLLDNSQSDIRLVLGTRPLNDFPSKTLLRVLEEVALNGRLNTLCLPKLDEYAMHSIAASVTKNPPLLKPILDMSEGNPQILFRSLLSLNIQGKLKKEGNLLLLPQDPKYLNINNDKLLSQFDNEPVAKWILCVLAVSHFDIFVESVKESALLFDAHSPLEILNKISELTRAKLVKYHSVDQEKTFLFLCHDSLKEIINRELKTERTVEYLQANEIASQLANYELNKLEYIKSDDNEEISKIDQSNERIASLLVGRTIAMREARINGWDKNVHEVLYICEKLERHNDTIDIAKSVLKTLESIESKSSENWLKTSASLAKAYYWTGQFSKCVNSINPDSTDDGELLFYHATSHLIAKDDNESVKVAQNAQKKISKLPDQKEWTSLLVLAEAVAKQESGSHNECEKIYKAELRRIEEKEWNQREWQFATASPLFTPAEQAVQLTSEASKWFSDRKDNRLSGMALNNQGYAYMRLGKYKHAQSCFTQAIELLNSRFPHEAIFPLNDLAFIHIINGDGDEAEKALTSCLFRRLAPEYKTTILVNLAYANWLKKNKDAAVYLDRINLSPGIEIHDWSMWQTEYAILFQMLLPVEGVPDQSVVYKAVEKIKTIRALDGISPYWNSLGREVKRRYGLTLPKLEEVKSKTVLSEIASPKFSILRPSALCFAHV